MDPAALTAFLARSPAWLPPADLRFVEGIWQVSEQQVSYPKAGHDDLPDDPSGWWYSHRAAMVTRVLGRPPAGSAGVLWDVGGGTGLMDPAIGRAGWRTVLVEPIPRAARQARGRADAVIAGTLEQLALPDDSVPAIGLFDVIEHLTDPVSLLAECRRVLGPGGRIIVTVPAYPWLWSSTDVAAGHKRRYTKVEMRNEAHAAGLRVALQEYIFASLVLPAIPSRLLGRRGDEEAALKRAGRALEPGPAGQRVLKAVMRIERALSRAVPLPFGLSLLAVLEDPSRRAQTL